QAMRVAIECAGFTASEADQLRRSMATFKFTGGVSHFRDKLVDGMVANGYEPEFAEKTFKQLEGFGSYGFPESHAASFALIANASRWDCTLEPTSRGDRFAVRLGLRMVRGLANADAAAIVAARADQPFVSVDDLWRRAGVPAAALVRLAEADAFRPSLRLARRDALWAIKALRDEPLPLFAAASAREAEAVPELREPAVALRPMTAGGEVVEDYGHVGLTLRNHPVSFLRG